MYSPDSPVSPVMIRACHATAQSLLGRLEMADRRQQHRRHKTGAADPRNHRKYVNRTYDYRIVQGQSPKLWQDPLRRQLGDRPDDALCMRL
jgi:hypothetical protein